MTVMTPFEGWPLADLTSSRLHCFPSFETPAQMLGVG
jgi:hypothetical protein